jgi:hypothetical protein
MVVGILKYLEAQWDFCNISLLSAAGPFPPRTEITPNHVKSLTTFERYVTLRSRP